MSHGQILLICKHAEHDQASRLSDALLAGWPGENVPQMCLFDPPSVTALDQQVQQVDAVWVYAGPAMSRSELYELLEHLEGHRLPTVLSRVNESYPIGCAFRDGVVIGPPDAAPSELRLLLSTLLCQGQMLREIKADLNIMRRHQDGLLTQIGQLDEELRLAARIQRGFLPTVLPQIGDVHCDVLFRPAGYVSGDIYDVQRLDENHIGFYVADAVGHGVPAALLTMFIKQALRGRESTNGSYRILPANEAMARLNQDLICRQASSTQFVTACYGTLNVATRELQLARAGHPPPFLLTRDGEVKPLEPEGPLLGVFEDEAFELMKMTLEPGDRLLIYSDGFELAFGEETLVSDGKHIEALHRMREGSLDQALRNLQATLDAQSGSLHQRDDMTALMVDIGRG